MTMQTPTGNAAAGGALPEVPAATLPAGLPDPATLARLAAGFFRAARPRRRAPEVNAGSGAVGGLPSALPAAAPLLSSLSNPAPAGSPLAGRAAVAPACPACRRRTRCRPRARRQPAAGRPTHVLLGNRAPRWCRTARRRTACPTTWWRSRRRWSRVPAAPRSACLRPTVWAPPPRRQPRPRPTTSSTTPPAACNDRAGHLAGTTVDPRAFGLPDEHPAPRPPPALRTVRGAGRGPRPARPLRAGRARAAAHLRAARRNTVRAGAPAVRHR